MIGSHRGAVPGTWQARALLASFSLACFASCSASQPCDVTKTGNPSNQCLPGSDSIIGSYAAVAKACGIDVECEGPGIALGNASISGVASVDAYFETVVRFRADADQLSKALSLELDAIRRAFGIPANRVLETELRAQIAAHVAGELSVQAGEPRCHVHARSVAAASASCQGDELAALPAEVDCRGRCEPIAGDALDCGSDAELSCTSLASASACTGQCVGRCASDLSAAQACAGICRGGCQGSCSRYADAAATQCAGLCDGMCSGSCEVELPAGGRCDGACTGECTLASSDGTCSAGSHARCEAAVGAAVRCAGRCEGDVEPARAKDECRAAVSAQAMMSAQCTPPRVAIDYRLAAVLDPGSSAQFELAMQMLEARLPSLLATLARAERMLSAGAELAGGADSALSSAESIGDIATDGDLRAAFGLVCALREAKQIPGVIEPPADRLAAAVIEATGVIAALGLQ
jgi:hypothetical protein